MLWDGRAVLIFIILIKHSLSPFGFNSPSRRKQKVIACDAQLRATSGDVSQELGGNSRVVVQGETNESRPSSKSKEDIFVNKIAFVEMEDFE